MQDSLKIWGKAKFKRTSRLSENAGLDANIRAFQPTAIAAKLGCRASGILQLKYDPIFPQKAGQHHVVATSILRSSS